MADLPLPLKTRSEWAIVAFGFLVTLALFILELTTAFSGLSRYWPLVGIIVGVVMLALHRVIAPDEW